MWLAEQTGKTRLIKWALWRGWGICFFFLLSFSPFLSRALWQYNFLWSLLLIRSLFSLSLSLSHEHMRRYLVSYQPAVIFEKIEILHYHRQLSSRLDVRTYFLKWKLFHLISILGHLPPHRSHRVHDIYCHFHPRIQRAAHVQLRKMPSYRIINSRNSLHLSPMCVCVAREEECVR